jgi:capsular polysaccharide biosynthesis protein
MWQEMNEQPLDVARTLRAIGRHRLVLASLLAIGLVLGTVYALTRPPQTVARATVLLPASPADSTAQQTRDIKTQLAIATSFGVLDRAGKTVSPPVPAAVLKHRVSASAATNDIVVVRARGGSPKQAVALANAVADQYVTFITGATSGQAEATVATIRQQADDLNHNIRDLETQISAATSRLHALPPGAPEAANDASVLFSLQAQQTDASRQLSTLQGRLDDAMLNGTLSAGNTRVLERAATASRSSKRRLFVDAGLAGLVGLLGGLLIAVIIDHGDRRLRWRDDMADAIGIPVLASIGAKRNAGVTDVIQLLEHYETNPTDEWSMRQALHHLGFPSNEAPSNITVVALAGDSAGLLIAPHLAAFAAGRGLQTALIIATHHPSATPLRSAGQVLRRAGGTRPARVWVEDSWHDEKNRRSFELTVTLVVFDRAGEALPAQSFAGPTLLAVSAGFATSDELAEVAVAAADAHQPLQGIVVANAAPDDRTTGRFPQPLRSPTATVPERAIGITRGSR